MCVCVWCALDENFTAIETSVIVFLSARRVKSAAQVVVDSLHPNPLRTVSLCSRKPHTSLPISTMERMWRKVNQGLISRPSASGKIRGGAQHHHQSVAEMLAAQENAAAATAPTAGAIVSFANDYPPGSPSGGTTRDRMSRSSSRRSPHQSTMDAITGGGGAVGGGGAPMNGRHHSANAMTANGSSAASTESRRRRRRKSKTRCNKNNRWVAHLKRAYTAASAVGMKSKDFFQLQIKSFVFVVEIWD